MKLRLSIIALLFVLLSGFGSSTETFAQPGRRTTVTVRTGPRHYRPHHRHRVVRRSYGYRRGYYRSGYRRHSSYRRHHHRPVRRTTVIVR